MSKNIDIHNRFEHQLTFKIDPCAFSLALSPDGKLLAGGGFDGIKIWDFETGEQIQRVEKFRS